MSELQKNQWYHYRNDGGELDFDDWVTSGLQDPDWKYKPGVMTKAIQYNSYQSQGGKLDFQEWSEKFYREDMINAEIIEYRSVERGVYYKSRMGDRQFYLSPVDQALLDKISQLPADVRISMVSLKEKDVIEYLDFKKNQNSQKLLDLLNKKWLWRSDGEPAELLPEYFNSKLTIRQIKSKLKKRLMSNDDIASICDFFDSERSEVYLKDEKKNEKKDKTKTLGHRNYDHH
jgi:hypothetical protein